MSNGLLGSIFGARPAAGGKAPPAAASTSASPGGMPGDVIKDVTTASFAVDVVQASRQQPVIVDFWAPWCGPCKQLTPVLERAVTNAGGKVRLAKMNIDDHPSIAGQLGVRSIPAVFAFVDGQPVDGFMGAVPESEVKAFIDRLTAGGGDPVADILAEAKARQAEGDVQGAAQLYGALLQDNPADVAALAGLAECHLTVGDIARAEAILAAAPADKGGDPAFAAVRNRLKLAGEVDALGDPQALMRRLDADADDHQARFDLALLHQAQGGRAQAAELLLDIIKRDRTWSDDAARRKLLEFFDAWGPLEPATKDARRRLSTLLFS